MPQVSRWKRRPGDHVLLEDAERHEPHFENGIEAPLYGDCPMPYHRNAPFCRGYVPFNNEPRIRTPHCSIRHNTTKDTIRSGSIFTDKENTISTCKDAVEEGLVSSLSTWALASLALLDLAIDGLLVKRAWECRIVNRRKICKGAVPRGLFFLRQSKTTIAARGLSRKLTHFWTPNPHGVDFMSVLSWQCEDALSLATRGI